MATTDYQKYVGQYGGIALGVANSLLGAWTATSQAKYQKAVVDANYDISMAQYDSQKQLSDQQYNFSTILQAQYNRNVDATNATQAYIASLNAVRAGQQLGEQYNATNMNIQRTINAARNQNFMTQIQTAEQMGRTAAAAAANGVTGTTVGLINQTQRLQSAIAQQAVDEGKATAVYDLIQQRAGIERNIADTAFNQVRPDYSQYDYSGTQKQLFIAPVKQDYTVPSFASSFIASLANSGLTFKDFSNAFGTKSA